jgi:S-DNA-T family DNA segregation ATPase FtsK/SpoIIIE
MLPRPINWPLVAGLGGVIGDQLLNLSFLFPKINPQIMIFVFSFLSVIIALYAGGALRSRHISYNLKKTNKEDTTSSFSNQHKSKKIVIGIDNKRKIFNKTTTQKNTSFKTTIKEKKIELPYINYLSPNPKNPNNQKLGQEFFIKKAEALTRVLEEFGIRGKIVQYSPGPLVTLYELEPAPGIKSARIIGLADDIARSMSALSARIALIAGRKTIGIELPHRSRETVYLREMLETQEFKNNQANLALILGKAINGKIVMTDLTEMPHLLIAGTTGSGKSMAIHTMIMSIIYRLRPEECRFIMIDPKMLELSVYDEIPHLLTPVITSSAQAISTLTWAVHEMENRYNKMAKIGVRNIHSFNSRIQEQQLRNENLSRSIQIGFDKKTGEPLFENENIDLVAIPYIVIIIDEIAELILTAGKEIEKSVQRLAQMARAAGIHLIIATQRPSADVITSTIKANFPIRISFAVPSKSDSRTILGAPGAEQLLGKGDMLFTIGEGRLQRIHGPFLNDSEIERVVLHLKKQSTPQYVEALNIKNNIQETTNLKEEFNDPYYDKAFSILLQNKNISISSIQQNLGIGYKRATQIIQKMEKKGFISSPTHTGKRKILIQTS